MRRDQQDHCAHVAMQHLSDCEAQEKLHGLRPLLQVPPALQLRAGCGECLCIHSEKGFHEFEYEFNSELEGEGLEVLHIKKWCTSWHQIDKCW